ncbi:putative zinc finger protein [Orchesella cincta]|uniref:Putative zinc finger protein n=1 Tax=Orchesella cincta TaxID=48709 RepID=A0A1D2N2B7_ORCCI|nr:putative zinc finger protein [Orchesella cincta]
MEAQIEKLLKMPSPPSKTVWKKTNSTRQPKVCNVCSKSFSNEDDLTNHQLSHSNTNGDSVKDSINKDRNNKPYSCTFCEKKSFTWLATLRAHYLNFHDELTFTEKKRLVDEAAEKEHRLSSEVPKAGEAPKTIEAPIESEPPITSEPPKANEVLEASEVETEKLDNPVTNTKSSGNNNIRKVAGKSKTESKKTDSRPRASRNRNISEDIIKKASKSISVEIGKPINSSPKKKSTKNIVIEASQTTPSSGRASLRRNIQRPKWLTDTDLVTDYEFPCGTNSSRNGSVTSSPTATQTVPSSSAVSGGAQTRASQATAKLTKAKKLEKAEKKKSRASVARNRVRTKSVDQIKVISDDSQTIEQAAPVVITNDTPEPPVEIPIPVIAENIENGGNADDDGVQDNISPDHPPLLPDNDKVNVITADDVCSEKDGEQIMLSSQEVPVLTREITNEIIESPKSCKSLKVDEFAQPDLDDTTVSCKTIDDIEISTDSHHSATPEAPVLCMETTLSNKETTQLPETDTVMMDSEETQAPPVIDVFNSKSADDENSSSSNQSTTLEAPVLSRETTNAISEVPSENLKQVDIQEELLLPIVEDVKVSDDGSSNYGDQAASTSSPLSVQRKDSTVSSGIVEPPESLEAQDQELEELSLMEEDDNDVIGPTRRRDRSDSLSMRSCGSGSQSEKIKGLEDTKEEECSTSKASEKDWAVDSDSNDSLMSEFSELAAQVSEKTDGVKFKEDCMRFISTKISANSMWAIRKELKRLKREKNYFKFGKLSPLAACLMHDLFCQSLK